MAVEISEADELAIRHALTTTVGTAMGSGRVIPAPIYFNDAGDYWASFQDADLETQDSLERSTVKCCWIYFKRFVDDQTDPPDSPHISLLYEFYLFMQYDSERQDESVLTPDAFNKLMLKRHNEFVASVLAIKGAFQGVRNMTALDTAVYTEQKTNSITAVQDVSNKGTCEFIPRLRGHVARFEESVLLRLKEC